MALKRKFVNKDTGFEKWGGYMEAKMSKLNEQFNDGTLKELNSTDEPSSDIFEGVAIYVNGFTTPSANELKRIMMMHGGKYHSYHSTAKTTHIIATNLPQVKIKRLKGNERIVKPEWITESVEAGKLLPFTNYLLYAAPNLQGQTKINEFSSDDNESLTLRLSSSENDDPIVEPANFIKVAKAGQPNFLSDYYGHSRLHHIATSGAEFKEYVKELHTNSDGNFVGRTRLVEWRERNGLQNIVSTSNSKMFMHIDMDCFFVSVGLLKRPDLIGQPVAVTHSRGNHGSNRTGTDIQYEFNHYAQKRAIQKELPLLNTDSIGSMAELACCSYEARNCGVKNGMLVGTAFKLCPNLKLIPFDFESYSKVSKILYDTIASMTLDIEALSCDEMFVDCSQVLKQTQTSATDLATYLRTEIKSKTGCSASAGLGSNLLLARLATKRAKPNGQFVVDSEAEFMNDWTIRSLPGVGSSTQQRLDALNVQTCRELQRLSLSTLQKEFGPKTGKTLYDHCRGIDDRDIQTDKERKSVSAEINYGMRFDKLEEAENFLKELSQEVEKRLQKIAKIGKQITLKLKIRCKDAPVETAKFMGHGACDNAARSASLRIATDSSETIGRESINLLRYMNAPAKDIRGMGIQVSKLENKMSAKQNKTLFEFMKQPVPKKAKETILDQPSTSRTLPLPSETAKEDILDQPSTSRTLPVPSEIDENVWAELPKDIQEQLSVMYKNEKQTPVECSTNELLPDHSQLDMNVLNALPEDIRQEVLHAYAPKSSPTKKKTSPMVKRGARPPKTKPNLRSLNFEPAPVVNVTKPTTATEQHPKTGLCGTTDLQQQKELISEWVNFSDPVEEDMDMFLTFLTSLIRDKDLEHLDLLLKHLFRSISDTCKPKWKEAYSFVVEHIQPVMVEKYDHVLNVKLWK